MHTDLSENRDFDFDFDFDFEIAKFNDALNPIDTIFLNNIDFRFLALLGGWLPVFSPTIAEPIDDYRLSNKGERWKQHINSSADRLVRVTIPADRELFHMTVSGVDRLVLSHGENPKALAQTPAPQYEYGSIEELTLSENGWLWINGSETDYVTLVDLKRTPPTLDHPVELSDLTREPCSLWSRFMGCEPAQGNYSPTLERAFVSSYRSKLLGQPDYVSLEVSG